MERIHADVLVERLRESGRMKHPEDRAVATTMLLSTMYGDALGRTPLPEVHATDAAQAPAKYVKVFLRALGVRT